MQRQAKRHSVDQAGLTVSRRKDKHRQVRVDFRAPSGVVSISAVPQSRLCNLQTKSIYPHRQYPGRCTVELNLHLTVSDVNDSSEC